MVVRLPIAILSALAITFLLYFGMNMLILTTGKEQDEQQSFKIIDTRIPPKQSELDIKDRKPPKPKEPEKPPEPPKFDQMASAKPSASATDMNFEFEGASLDGGISFEAASDRDVLPIVRVEPIYPSRAMSRGIEGYVILEFTVLASGAVDEESIIVLEGDPEGMFDSAAMRAVRKWKYRPKVVAGKPVPQYGIRTKLTFQLED
ncbi:MAG: energy transducer TonB [Sphingomonadales bacterium]